MQHEALLPTPTVAYIASSSMTVRQFTAVMLNRQLEEPFLSRKEGSIKPLVGRFSVHHVDSRVERTALRPMARGSKSSTRTPDSRLFGGIDSRLLSRPMTHGFFVSAAMR
jgi:hypothetical protein